MLLSTIFDLHNRTQDARCSEGYYSVDNGATICWLTFCA